MAFLKFLFYALLYLLIKLGDTVYFAITLPLKLLTYLGKIHLRKYSPNKKYSKKQTISRKRKKNFVLFSNALRILRLTTSAWKRKKALGLSSKREKRATRKSLKAAKQEVFPGFFFKLKYTVVGTIIAFVFFFLPATFLMFISDLPKLSNLSVNYIPKTTKILDRNGNLLFEVYANQNRTIVKLSKIPQSLTQATIAIEDKDFYSHDGFDIRGIVRAAYVDLTKEKLQGGSTITQQLVKSALLTPDPTITRKVKELVLAFWAEQKYSKNEILELYFNYVPYGGTAWGVEAASQIYFGKTVTDLSLAESAYLAGLPQAPSVYSPFASDGVPGKRRQRDVLNAMAQQGYITKEEANKAYKEKLSFKSPQVPIKAPHFVMYVKNVLASKYGLLEVERGGLQVTTTLDINTQRKAEAIVSEEVERDRYLGVGNGASLVTNPSNGDILAMVGSTDYFNTDADGNVNITTSLRQPGSTIKLIIYALALSRGLTEATILDDTPITITNPGAPSYTPVNYDGRFHGKIPLRLAFANSYNIPAVRLAQRFGVEQIVNFAKEMGISSWGSPDKYGVSITLGAAETSMIDLATAYGTVANGGERVDLNPILKITDSEGNVIEEKKVEPVPVINPGVAFIISDILADDKARSLSFGIGSTLKIPDKRVSVKTGTTDNKRDNWTIGFTPTMLVATWVGNNDNTPLSPALASGITGAAPMWNQIMTTVLEGKNVVSMTQPENVVAQPCFGYTAYFIKGTDNPNSCKFRFPTPTF